MAHAKIPDIGKYHIIELVGEGAMGVVYKAVDTVLNRTVAVKVMSEAIARQEELRQRFLREAQAAASLQHPNVVSVYDLGEVDGHLFIAMEFVQGVDLEQIIAVGEPLNLQAKLDIAIDVLTGLSFAHKRGIVHRDIKPANIRVGEDGRAKIMDFGVAHLASSSLTSTGTSLGTPGYMAPEQITGGTSSAATDIFAVGGVLYELLTGVKAFEGTTLQNLFFRIITERPRPIRELNPGLPAALERIIDKAMAKEPSNRYASAIAMADELSAVRGKLSGPPYPSTVSLRTTVETAIQMSRETAEREIVERRNNTRRLAVGGAIVAILVAAIAWAKMGGSSAPNERLAAAPAPAASAPSSAAQTPATEPAPQPAPARSDSSPSARREVVTTPPPPAPVASRPERSAASERAARAAAQREAPAPTPSATSTRTTQRPAPPVTPPASIVNAQPSVTPPPTRTEIAAPRAPVVPAGAATPPERTPPAPTIATAADLAPTVDAYARAIESRDVAAIRRVYPGLTPDQQRGFEQFFQAARSINVTFRIANVEATSASADVRLTGTYAYVTTAGRSETQPVSFAATLRRDGSEWRLASVR
jgi:eukaryotic-like serine/threonine-protein kinase